MAKLEVMEGERERGERVERKEEEGGKEEERRRKAAGIPEREGSPRERDERVTHNGTW